MAQTLEIRMNRCENSPWGFRLHGGADFGSPLKIQKVNTQSPSEAAGLKAGDIILAVNGRTVDGYTHKEAQNCILKAGNQFQLTVQRDEANGRIWKPEVVNVGLMPTKPTKPGQVFTQTSLAANKKEDSHWDVKHNQTAKGFSTCSSRPSNPGLLASKQYNCPVNLYSESSIKEALAAGALGSDGAREAPPSVGRTAKGPEPHADGLERSETLRMVREMDQHGPASGEGEDAHLKGLSHTKVQSSSFLLLQRALDSPVSSDSTLALASTTARAPRIRDQPPGFARVSAPVTKLRTSDEPVSLPTCTRCDRLITGVFCQVKSRPLHPECFVCEECRCPLKNTGYFSVGDKLLCERHARSATDTGPAQDTRARTQQSNGKQQWEQILESNAAGMATSAEAFTKQFMSQMYGGQPLSSKESATPPQKSLAGHALPARHPAPEDHLRQLNGLAKHLPGGGGVAEEDAGDRMPRLKKDTSSPSSGSGPNPSPAPQCHSCLKTIQRGPFITAMGRSWCPAHFVCAKPECGRSLQDLGFVEEKGQLYCENCFAKYLAPECEKCSRKILGNCLKAMGKTFHPECFVCAHCGKIFANSPFYLEDSLPYCEQDWNELFTTKCVSCGYPIEAGDRWVEALNSNYHSQCFNCTMCKKNLEGQGFFVKAGKPFCKSHARLGI